jgi:hypothetical protein
MRAATQRPQAGREHEFEAQYGLPERLPADEQLLWQGGPDWKVLARRSFHADKVAVYFALLLAWQVAQALHDGEPLALWWRGTAWLALAGLIAVGLLAGLAAWTASTTVYTLTDKRIVMRIGIVLTVAYNLPFKCIEAADVHDSGGDTHDIALTLEGRTRIAWLHLWPHVRPWQFVRPQPMLRALKDADAVAAQLTAAWAAANATTARRLPAQAASPAPGPMHGWPAMGVEPR